MRLRETPDGTPSGGPDKANAPPPVPVLHPLASVVATCFPIFQTASPWPAPRASRLALSSFRPEVSSYGGGLSDGETREVAIPLPRRSVMPLSPQSPSS